jgi:hypothetical protein
MVNIGELFCLRGKRKFNIDRLNGKKTEENGLNATNGTEANGMKRAKQLIR